MFGVRTTHVAAPPHTTVMRSPGQRMCPCRSTTFVGEFGGVTWAPGQASDLPWSLVDALPAGLERVAGDAAGGR